jgi:hypothetical protein
VRRYADISKPMYIYGWPMLTAAPWLFDRSPPAAISQASAAIGRRCVCFHSFWHQGTCRRQSSNTNPGSTTPQRPPPGRLSQSPIVMHRLRHPGHQWPASLGGSRALRPPLPNRNPAPATTTLQQAIRCHKAAARRPSTSNPTRGAGRSQTSASLHSASNDSHRSINNSDNACIDWA